MPETLYLIDGHALAYRTYFALTSGGSNTARWTTSSGEPTAGTYGFMSVLMRYLEQDRPDYLMVAFDVGKTFRDDLFPDYKGTREKMPDDLRIQIERIREVVDTFNIPRLEADGYEADDVLGSAAKKAAAHGLGVKIITGDRDLLQLVDERIVVTLPEGRSLAEARDYTADDVVEKMGVLPEKVIDLKALEGDKSDNIPGVYGVGSKTAIKLLDQYHTLDGIYEHIDEIKGSLHKKLVQDKEQAYLSQKLATIVTDLDVELNLEKARVENFDPAAVEAIFRELEFRTLMKRLVALIESFGKGAAAASPARAAAPAAAASTHPKGQLSMFSSSAAAQPDEPEQAGSGIEMVIVDTEDKLAGMIKILEKASVISFDTETTGTDKMAADLVGISLSAAPGKGYYVPVGHDEGKQLPLQHVLDALRPCMTDPSIPKIAHNMKFDYVMLLRYGLKVSPLGFDSMLAEWLRDPSSRNLGLKKLSWVRLGTEMTELTDLIGTGKKQVTMAQVPVQKAAAYAADDAEVVIRLKPILERDLAEVNAEKLFHELEMPLVPVLAGMEMHGIGVDREYLAEMSADLGAKIDAAAEQVYEAVGEPFNLNSTQQLSDALFNKLGIEPPAGTRKTSSGYYSTAAGVLEALQDDHEVVGWVLNYREMAKLKSTYVDALPTQINPETGRIHTSYNQTGSVTGRIASSDPNLQNIPIRTEMGRRIRRAFVAVPGHALLAVDYSQVELRLAAHMSGDEAMIEAFRAGQDIHATTAAAIYEIPLQEVSRSQRRHAKAINFGLIYGMSPFGLTRTTELTLAEAEDFVEAYFKRFPGVKRYLDGIRKTAAEQGFVETLMGRRRYFPALKSGTNPMMKRRAEREAINAPIQGTAADIMKLAMLAVPPALEKAGPGAKMLLQVHDELVFEVPEEEVQLTAEVVRKTMEGVFPLDVPLLTEAKAGPNWYELAPVEQD